MTALGLGLGLPFNRFSSREFALSDITGLFAWWRADDLAQADGSNVTSWTDRVSGRVLTNSATAPTYETNMFGTRSAVHSSGGIDRSLSCTFGVTLTQPTTIFLVKYTSFVQPQIFLDGIGASTRHAIYRGVGPTTLSLASSTPATSAVDDDLNNKILTSIFNNPRSVLRDDGVTLFDNGGTGTNTLTGLLLFKDQSGSFFMNGGIAEVIIYNSLLSEADCITVEEYLGAYYGIAV